jgi:hypothetical protein
VVFTASGTLGLRLAGPITALVAARSANLAIVVRQPAVRLVPILGKAIVAASTVELLVRFDELGVGPGQDLEFCLQIRDADGAVLESLPHHGLWTVAVPAVPATDSNWQA